MERIIPDLQNHLIRMLISDGETVNEESYIKSIEARERRYENSLIDTFARLGVRASVKTDKYSLPYKHEIVTTLEDKGSFEFYNAARVIVKEVLNKDIYNLRFYLLMNVTDKPRYFGGMEYRFRYFIH